MKKVTIKDCIEAVKMFNAGTIDEDAAMEYLYEYDDCHDTIILCDKEYGYITRLYLVNQYLEEVRAVWSRNKRATVTTCINAAIAYNKGTITEDEMLHTFSDYDCCHKNMIFYDTSSGKVIGLYLADENIITVKTVWQSDWIEGYRPPTRSEIMQYIKNIGREASLASYALMNNELHKMLDSYNDTHKSQLNIQINSLDYNEYGYKYITLYCIRREGDRNRTDKIMKWNVNVR